MAKSVVRRIRWARLLVVALALASAQLATRLAEQVEATPAAEVVAADATRRAVLVEARAEALQRRSLELEEALSARRLRVAADERRVRPLPAIGGQVLSVRANVVPSVALLSVGRRQGLERGFHLTVYRGPRFVAKVVAEAVDEDVALARVLFTAEGEAIHGGDLVATRLD